MTRQNQADIDGLTTPEIINLFIVDIPYAAANLASFILRW
jgi:hypothetical protein